MKNLTNWTATSLDESKAKLTPGSAESFTYNSSDLTDRVIQLGL